MDWETLGQVAAACLAIGAALLQYRRRRAGPRDQIRQDIELLQILPEGEARDHLVKHVEASVRKLVVRETELRREPVGIGLGIAFMIAAVVAGLYGFHATGWLPTLALWVVAVVLGTLGAVGFAQDVVPRKRNDKGVPVE